MSDAHIRLLAAVVRHRERERDAHNASANRSAARRIDVSRRATRARAQMDAARARRRLATHDRFDL